MAVLQNTCGSCREAQMNDGKDPRTLTLLPTEVTQHKAFQRKGLPVKLCPFCDGDALSDALKAHKDRTKR